MTRAAKLASLSSQLTSEVGLLPSPRLRRKPRAAGRAFGGSGANFGLT